MASEQNNDQNNDQNQSLMTGGGTQSAAQGGLAGSAANSQNNNADRKGSGSFTNLNKYVNANQQGSANLAGRIGTGIQNQLTSKEKDTQNLNSTVDNSVQQGNSTLEKGQGFDKDLSAIGEGFKKGADFNVLSNDRGAFGEAQKQAQNFQSSPNYNEFQNIQSGNAINNNQINSQQQAAQTGANAYSDLFKQRQAQVGNTEGRSQALNEFVGGGNQAFRPAYSSGQNRLDNLILSKNGQNLQGLINNVGANQSNVQNAMNTATQNANAVTGLNQNEDALLSQLGQTGKTLQQNYQNAFGQDKFDQVNKARQTSYDADKTQLLSGQMSEDLLKRLGANDKYNEMENIAKTGNLDPYNLSNPNDGALSTGGYLDRLRANQGDLDSVLKQQPIANSYNDLTNQNDVNTDKSIANIVGGGQKFNNVNNNINTGSTVDSAQFLKGMSDSFKNQPQFNASTPQQLQELRDYMSRNAIKRV